MRALSAALFAAVVAVVAVVVGGSSGCPGPIVLACADDGQCPPDHACSAGACVLALPTNCAGSPTLSVTLTSDGAPLCSAVVTALDDHGVDHALAPALDRSGACVFASADVDGHVIVHALAFNRGAASTDITIHKSPTCAPTTATLELTTIGGSCDADSGCTSGICTVKADAASASCRTAAPGVRDLGDGCAGDEQCAHGLCLGALCSGLCSADGGCAASQRCAPDAALEDATVCTTRGDLPVESCDDDADCADTGRLCSDIVGGALSCRLPPAGTAPIGAACTSEGVSSTCASGLCDDAVAGRCTTSCTGDADCTADGNTTDAQSTCTSIAIDGVSARACFQTCATLADCAGGPERTCRARVDVPADAVVFACDGARGSALVGDVVTSADECGTNFALTTTDGTSVCSAPCNVDGDCAQNTVCLPATLLRPSGGNQGIDACQTVP